jgi:hypothetical protein
MKWPFSAKISLTLSLTIALCALGAILWLRFARPPKPNYDPTPHHVTEAPAPKPIAKVRRVKTPPPKEIKAYNPVEVAGKLKMPELAFTDNTLVLDVATIPSHTADTTAVATLSPGDSLPAGETPLPQDETGMGGEGRIRDRWPRSGRDIRKTPAGRAGRDGGKRIRKK